MEHKDCVLALDLGTTGNRAVVFDKSLKAISSSYREFTQHFPKPGWVEHDPEEIWRTTLAVLRQAVKRVGAGRIAAIGITNQRETVVIWHRGTGRAVGRAIVWQDRRTAPLCEALRKKGWEQKIHARTGLTLDPYFSATKISWALDHNPALRRSAEKGDLLFGTVDSWILWKLTGGSVHATDPSNASRTLLYNLKARAWDPELFRLFKIPSLMAPEVKPSGGRFGDAIASLLGKAIPIFSMLGDQQAALFGQGGLDKGVVKNTYGTGLFLLRNTGTAPVFAKGLLSSVGWEWNGKTEYVLEGSVFIGGALLQWLRDGLQIIQSAQESAGLARSVEDSGGLMFVPALAGLGAPYWDAAARGLIIGITRGTTRAHIVRAALESLALQTKDTVDAMVRATGQKISKLCVDGGASANDFLMQLQADLLGIPVERPRVLESTALGAAGLAGLASGLWKNAEEFLRHRRVDRLFRPKMKSVVRKKLLNDWKSAVGRSRNWAK